MSKRTNTYPEVSELPPSAQSVENYAIDKLKSKPPYVYKLHKEGKLAGKGVQIVIFEGYNFVIPLPKTEEKALEEGCEMG